MLSLLLHVLLHLLGCTLLRGTSSPLKAGVDNDLDDFYPIVNGLPAGFVFGTASAAYQASAGRACTKINPCFGLDVFHFRRVFWSRCSEGGESVLRLSLGRRLVNLSPVAQPTNAFNIRLCVFAQQLLTPCSDSYSGSHIW